MKSLPAAVVLFAASLVVGAEPVVAVASQPESPEFHDVHFHFTDYIQREMDLGDLLGMMGERVGRATLMAIPLQQKWDYLVSGERAPDYYLRSDSPLYYYPFADAMVAEAALALDPAERARFDPMITGFNPTDMYAVDHIERALRMYPGVFSGIGEFSVHKEVVSSKTLGHTASLRNPALDRILRFAGESGLLVLVHCDVDVILPRAGAKRPARLEAFLSLARRHPETTIVWAHAGLGRFVEPVAGYAEMLEAALRDERHAHLHLDLSWDVVAEQVAGDPGWADLVSRFPDRFLIGSDSVVPATAEAYLRNLDAWSELLDRLTPAASHAVRVGNYERLFGEARRRVRAFEAATNGASGR